MHIEVPMPDIDNDRDRRLERRDISEILFGTNPKVNATLLCRLQEVWNDVLKAALVGEQVIRTEYSIFLRRFFGQVPKLLVRELFRRRCGCVSGWDCPNTDDNHENQRCCEQE